MKYLSLFSGIGGFEKGIQQAYDIQNLLQSEKQQHEATYSSSSRSPRLDSEPSARLGYPRCVGFSEINIYATRVYQQHFPTHHNYGDITKIDANELPDFDLLVGGFPCQSFSIAGKRKGFDDTRGTLFFDIARILRAKHPRLFVLENVKGLLSHDNGKTFSTIITTLDELGYDLQWQVLNSKNHGVPQNRERVFIVGHLRGTPRPEVFPFGGTGTKDLVQETSGDIRERMEPRKDAISRQYQKTGKDFDWDAVKQELTRYPDIRRLTPTECARLQGFPDDWCSMLSDSQAYKCYGNAVTVNVIQDIMEKIL